MSHLPSITQQSTNYSASVAGATGHADPTFGCSGSVGLGQSSNISGSDTSQARTANAIPKIFRLSMQNQAGNIREYALKLDRFLGEGSSGVVFQASLSTANSSSTKMYALKVSKIFPDDPEATRRSQALLLREAQMLSKWKQINPEGKLSLAHMHLGPFDLGPDRKGCLLELYGLNILNYLERKTPPNTFSLDNIRRCTCQLLQALDALEKAGIIHADIKPENIVLNLEGNQFYIIDAGISLLCPLGKNRRANTAQEYVISLGYRPPEVVFHKAYGHAADRWSLMCVLFEMHTGQVLFPAQDTPSLKNMFVSLMGPAPQEYITDGSALPSSTVDAVFSKQTHFSNPLDAQLVCKSGNPEEEGAFKEFLEMNFKWEQETRLTAAQMIRHPFFAPLVALDTAIKAKRKAEASSESGF